MRGTGTVTINKKNLRTNPLISTLFGYEGTLAAKNMKRSHRSFRATVTALSIGVILFICLGSLSSEVKIMKDYMNPNIDQTIISEYTSARTRKINKNTGREESIYLQPIDSKLGDEITKKLSDFDKKEIFGIGNDSETYYTELSKIYISDQMSDALDVPDESKYELSVEIITLDELNYKQLCEKANVPLGSTILLNHYSYNDNGKMVDLIPFLPNLKSVNLMKADGSNNNVQIQGVLTQKEMPKELFYLNTNVVRLIVPNAEVRVYSWYSDPTDIDGFMEYANDVLSQTFPENVDTTYMKSGFNTRVYRIDDYMKVMNIAIVLFSIFMYSFVALLMLIGFTNVISTISTNVLMRSREFAILQSIVMTPEGLKKMLNLESILCSLKSLVIGVPVGIIITYLINIPLKSSFPIPYKIPWLSVIFCTAGVFIITFSTTRLAVHKLHNHNIIETIRAESGR